MAELSLPSAAVRVLTQPTLFSHITAFQSGILGIARTLLQRIDADELPETRRRRRCQHHQAKKQELKLFRALACYDGHDLHALQIILRATTFKHANPWCERLWFIRRVYQAAAAYGRVDMLQFLHDQLENDRSHEPGCKAHLVFDANNRPISYSTWEIVLQHWSPSLGDNAKEVLQWFVDRDIGGFNLQLVDKVIRLGNVEALRLCLTRYQPRNGHGPGIVLRAVKAGHLDMVRLLLVEYRMDFDMATVELALHLRHDGIALLLLEHRDAIKDTKRRMLKPSIIQGIVRANEMNRLIRLTAVPDCANVGISMDALLIRQHLNKIPTPARVFQNPRETFRLLLPVSSLQSVVLNIIVLAVNEHSAIYMLLECASVFAIPDVLVAFVKRARRDRLGPLTRQIMSQAPLDEICETLPKASPDDVRDAVLVMLRTNMVPSPSASVQAADLCKWIEPVLQFDLARTDGRIDCDTEFLMACVSMSRSDDYRRCLEQSIDQLQARRVVG